MTDLEARIARLEAIEAIKALKARYWYCCDQKDVNGVRDCFLEGPVEIHYDGPVGLIRHRDELREVFESVACKTQIVEMHHGGPPDIEVTGGEARGRWGLVYHLLDTNAKTVSVCGGYYDDQYRSVDDRWWIVRSRFEVCSAVTYGWNDTSLRMLHAGAQLPPTAAS